MSEKTDIIFLGTGNALTTRCYNTCFILRSQGSQLMVDAGGGNGILQQLQKKTKQYTTARSLFRMISTSSNSEELNR